MVTLNPNNDIIKFEFLFQGKWITCEEIIPKALSAQDRTKLKKILEAKKRDIRKDIQFWMLDHPNDSPEYLWALIEMHTKFNGALDLITNFEAVNK